jgi:uncharacterized protein
VAKKIVIMLLNVSPEIPTALGVPFFQASAAAAMDLEVEIYFASRTALLLRKGVAETLYPSGRREKSVYGFMQDAHRLGAKFYTCQAAMTEYGLDADSAIPELDGVAGGAAFISAIADEGVVTLTY